MTGHARKGRARPALFRATDTNACTATTERAGRCVNSPGTGRTARRPDVTNVPESHDYVVALALLRRMVAAGALWRHGDVIHDEAENDVLVLTPDEQYLLRRIEEEVSGE